VFPLTDAYLEDSPHACPRQAEVNGINIGDDIPQSLEFVQESHHLVRLLKEVYLAIFVAPRPSLDLRTLLKLSCASVHFTESSISTYGVRGPQRSSYCFLIVRLESLEGLR
jgi:hypothetical protein